MSEIGRNINGAFDKGYDAFDMGERCWPTPYKANHMQRAWRAGWDKAQADRRSSLRKFYGDEPSNYGVEPFPGEAHFGG